MSVNQLIRGRSKTLTPEIRDLILSFTHYGISDLVGLYEETLTTCHPKIFKTQQPYRTRFTFDICDCDGEPLWNIVLSDVRYSRKTGHARKITYCDCTMSNYRTAGGIRLPLRPSHPCSKTDRLASEVSRVVLGIIPLPADYSLFFHRGGCDVPPPWFVREVMTKQDNGLEWECLVAPILDDLKI